MTKGFKTSELWVVILLVVGQYMQSIGVDQTAVQAQVAEIAKQLQLEAGGSGPTATWIALAYVVGRQILKWRELGKDGQQDN